MLPLDDGLGAGPGQSSGGDGDRGRGSGADEPTTDHDRPIGFALTARARRAVAPDTLPALRVVPDEYDTTPRPDGGSLEAPDDTRPARARALRRAGVPVSAITSQLGADPLAVTAWIGEVSPSAPWQAPSRSVEAEVVLREQDADDTGPASSAAAPTRDDDELAVQLARAAAAERARERLDHQPAFAVAAGLLAATATTDRYAVTITTSDPRQALRMMATLREEDPDSAALARVVLRLGPSVAADLTRHRVATQLDLAAAQVAWTRWKHAPQPDAVQLLVRIGDPALAACVAGWIDAVLDPSPEPVDLAF